MQTNFASFRIVATTRTLRLCQNDWRQDVFTCTMKTHYESTQQWTHLHFSSKSSGYDFNASVSKAGLSGHRVHRQERPLLHQVINSSFWLTYESKAVTLSVTRIPSPTIRAIVTINHLIFSSKALLDFSSLSSRDESRHFITPPVDPPGSHMCTLEIHPVRMQAESSRCQWIRNWLSESFQIQGFKIHWPPRLKRWVFSSSSIELLMQRTWTGWQVRELFFFSANTAHLLLHHHTALCDSPENQTT